MFTMKGEICTVVTIMGEIVGRIKEIDNAFVTVESPRLFVNTAEGMGFAPGVCASGEHDAKEISINMHSIVTITKTHAEIERGWVQQTSGIVIQ